jgi:hypothetical protein
VLHNEAFPAVWGDMNVISSIIGIIALLIALDGFIPAPRMSLGWDLTEISSPSTFLGEYSLTL